MTGKLLTFCVLALLCACKTSKAPAEQQQTGQLGQMVTLQTEDNLKGSVHAIPRAVVYKTNGDYNDYVPVTLNAAGTEIVSYPGPGDVAGQTPIQLEDGWLLDRRGISKNSAFLDYTYAEYAKLKEVPSLAELREHIIPGAKVTECHNLKMSLSEALSNLSEVKKAVAAADFAPVRRTTTQRR